MDAPIPLSLEERALGAFLGLAVGDALGATVEFMTAGEILATHGVHREVVGGGWLRLAPGAVTDDTEMSLCAARAIVASQGLELRSRRDAHGTVRAGDAGEPGAARARRGGASAPHPPPPAVGRGLRARGPPPPRG